MHRSRLIRLAVAVLAAVVGAGATAGNAHSALFFLFEPTRARPGDVVTVRTGGTPASLTLRQRVKPFQRPIRLYLVPNRLAPDVHSMIWIAGPLNGALKVRYWRIDAPGPTLETTGISGTLSGFAGRSWASRMSFTEGCWMITERVQDITLSFVISVVAT